MLVEAFKARPWSRFRFTNDTSTSSVWGGTTKPITVTEPVGTDAPSGSGTARSVITLVPRMGGEVPNAIQILPFGTGSSGDQFGLYLIGWRRCVPVDTNAQETWIGSALTKITCTLTGIQGPTAVSQITSSENICDTISIGQESTFTAVTTRDGLDALYSPADSVGPAWIMIPLYGVEKIELIKYNVTNTPAGNALFTLLSRF
jgi:hypothetical protein